MKLNSRVLVHSIASLSLGVPCLLFAVGIGKIRATRSYESVSRELKRRVKE